MPPTRSARDRDASNPRRCPPDETRPLILSTKAPAAPTPLPKLQVAALLLLILLEALTSTLIYPFIVKLVSSLHIVKGDPAKVGYYAGLIEASFFVTEAVFVFFWGRVSDKVGRKPVLLFGSLGLAAALTSLGFSTTLFGVMASQALQGSMTGNTGVVRAMLSEVTDASNRALAFGFQPIFWASGATFGPLIGGLLANPADNFSAFKSWFWVQHPHLLPCVAAASLSLAAFLSTLTFVRETHSAKPAFLKQILHSDLPPTHPVTPATSPPTYGTVAPRHNQTDAQSDSSLAALCTRRLLGVLVNHALLALLDHSYVALMSLFLATPISFGGLGLSPSHIGMILGATGLVHGVLQALCFPPLYRTYRPKRLYTACQMAIVPAYMCFPLVNALARSGTGGVAQPCVWIALVFQLFLLLPSYTAFSAMFIFISAASPSPALLGTTNGVAQTIFSSMGAIGPIIVTSLFALSEERHILGGNLVYVVMCSIGVTSVITSILFLPANPGEEAGELNVEER